jgi:cysteine desulfurase
MKAPLYLDHNATTPVDSEVLEAMLPYFSEAYGNPSSVMNAYGSAAAAAVNRAREQVAHVFGVLPDEIVFTGSCTEANNLAIVGVVEAHHGVGLHIITSSIEHPSVARVCDYLEKEGRASITRIPVDEAGLVDPGDIVRALRPSTKLVSVMGANNEVGTKQPIAEIAELCAQNGVVFHTDMAQLVADTSIKLAETGIAMASLSSHKLYGPKGIGALYVRSTRPRVRLRPIIHGGAQERGYRSGTLNVPAIVGMGKAFELIGARGQSERARIKQLADLLSTRLLAAGAVLNGHPTERIVNNVAASFPNVDPHALMRNLRDDISFSTSSACSTSRIETSPVLLAMYGDTWRARNGFRLGLGRGTTQHNVEFAAEAIAREANRLASLVRATQFV